MESSSRVCVFVHPSPVLTYGGVHRWPLDLSPRHLLATLLHTCKRSWCYPGLDNGRQIQTTQHKCCCASPRTFSLSAEFPTSTGAPALFSFWFRERKINLFLFFTLCSNARFSAFQHPSSAHFLPAAKQTWTWCSLCPLVYKTKANSSLA